MRKIQLIVWAAFAVVNSGMAWAEEQTLTMEVGGLWCESCPYIAAQAIQSVNSVEIIDGFYDPDLQIAQFVVTYDDVLTNADAIIAAPDEYGYPGKLIEKIEY